LDVPAIEVALPGAATAKLRTETGFNNVTVDDKLENVTFATGRVALTLRIGTQDYVELDQGTTDPLQTVAVTLASPGAVGTETYRAVVEAAANIIGSEIRLSELSPLGLAAAATDWANTRLLAVANNMKSQLNSDDFAVLSRIRMDWLLLCSLQVVRPDSHYKFDKVQRRW
jgi:hypothetical protein